MGDVFLEMVGYNWVRTAGKLASCNPYICILFITPFNKSVLIYNYLSECQNQTLESNYSPKNLAKLRQGGSPSKLTGVGPSGAFLSCWIQ